MSGGSLDYAYRHVEEAAQTILERAELPAHKAFAKHLVKVAKALHDLEWVWSGDCSDGDIESIMAVITPNDVLVSAIEEAKKARDGLDYAIKNAGVEE